MKKNLSFEQAVSRLEEIVAAMEDESVTLEESMALFEEGVKLAAGCEKTLSAARQKVTELAASLAAPEEDVQQL